jgi:hypothetical protein
MKKIVAALACSFFAMSGFAQRYYTNEPSGAILFVAGFNTSRLHTDTAKYTSVKTPMGGLLYSRVLSGKFNVNFGGIYVAKGYNNEKEYAKHRYFYVDIPLYAQYKASDDIRFDLGAQYSIFTNAVTTNTNGGTHRVSGSASLKPADYGFMAGIDAKLNTSLDITARYTRSLSSFKGEPGFSSLELHIHYYMLTFYGHGKRKEEGTDSQ